MTSLKYPEENCNSEKVQSCYLRKKFVALFNCRESRTKCQGNCKYSLKTHLVDKSIRETDVVSDAL